MTENTPRRTKRRYAHELYPVGEEGVVRPLSVELPRLYAIAMGSEVWGTGWFDAIKTAEGRREAADRTVALIYARQAAFLADALAQGLTGDAAWTWAEQHLEDESGELAYERAEHYGVNPALIKPYPCGPQPTSHDHMTNMVTRSGVVTRIPIPESECVECTELVPE